MCVCVCVVFFILFESSDPLRLFLLMYNLQGVILKQSLGEVLAHRPLSEPEILCRLQLLFMPVTTVIHAGYNCCSCTVHIGMNNSCNLC